MSVVDTFVNGHTLSLAAVVVFALTVFGVSIIDENQLALGLTFLAAANVVE